MRSKADDARDFFTACRKAGEVSRQAQCAVFGEHFVTADEPQTNYVAQREAGALLADLAARWAKRPPIGGKREGR